MKLVKIGAALLLPLLVGVFIIIFVGQNISADTSIEPFFTAWLIFMPVCSGFVCGRQYPQTPVRAGIICGAVLAVALVVALFCLLPVLRAPLFYLILSLIAMAIAVFSAFWGAAAKRASLIWRERKQPQPDKNDDLG